MLNVLKKYSEIGHKGDLLYFLRSIIGTKTITKADIAALCLYPESHYRLNAMVLIDFFSVIGMIECNNEQIKLNSSILEIIDRPDCVVKAIISSTVRIFFEAGIFTCHQFRFNATTQCYEFKNELVSLAWASVRNLLVECGFFIINRSRNVTHFYVSDEYVDLLASQIKKTRAQKTLIELKEQLKRDEEAGALAEEFVVRFERRRIGDCTKDVRQISGIDVNAGYDILSYDSKESVEYDRFIEVKAISKEKSFYWSKNEVATAKLKGEKYHLYLVELWNIHNDNYSPIIISNPKKVIFHEENWLVEPQLYYVKHVIF